MWRATEFVPDDLKSYCRLTAAKLRHPRCFIGSPYVARTVTLGDGVSISRNAEVGHQVCIGDHSYVNCGAIVASGSIGRFCSIGPYALILHLSTSPKLYGRANILRAESTWDDFPAPPVIGSDVWVGAFAFVKQGVRIGHGAIVGAGAVVTRDVPPYAIVGGVPARLIRHRFPPATIDSLLETEWWERDPSELEASGFVFQRPWKAEVVSS